MGLILIYHNKIASKIEEHKSKYGSTKTWIANKASLSRQTIDSLEKTDNPNIQSLIKLAYALDCDIKDLYDVEYHYDF